MGEFRAEPMQQAPMHPNAPTLDRAAHEELQRTDSFEHFGIEVGILGSSLPMQ